MTRAANESEHFAGSSRIKSSDKPPSNALSSVHDHAPVLGNVEPFLAHSLVVLAIFGGFSRAGSRRILFGFGDGLRDFWRFAQAGGRDKRNVPRQQSALRRHGKSFPDTRQTSFALVTDMGG